MRINLFGGPGAGKSTTAARIFAELKERHINVEHVGEYVKSWAYQQRLIKPFDQVYLLGKQMQYEYRYLSNGVQHIVTDSPCFLSVVYQLHYGKTPMAKQVAEGMLALVKAYDSEFPSLNIFLDRGDKEYHQEGRYQTRDQAVEVDSLVQRMLEEHYPGQAYVKDYTDKQGILDLVLQHVG